ncbi:hypothetical protein E9934_07880 [Nocardioides caeni]|uniref:FHA domain-containing protein n=1 Tax=Nocardioides caeni TaxID=574700 RepID=A0A4S8NER9_9ACTN|nr:hypothetical protein [Nocardioides caeni]THV14581.1 hypothetical protein E9934_07880 [Nocardioides caeni]
MSETTPGPGPSTSGSWSYRTGDWFAVFGSSVTIVLPESQRDQVVALWALVDGGAGFDEVLDGLLSAGLSRVPGFVLASTDGSPTRILLRGAGVQATAVAADGDVVLDGAASHTWVERSLADLTSLQVDLPVAEGAAAGAADLPIVTGLVRVGRINLPPAVAAPLADEPVREPAMDSVMEPVIEPVMTPVSEPVLESSAGGAHLADSPVDAPAAAAESAPLDDEGPATEVMEAISGDPLSDPLSAPLADPPADPLADPRADPLTDSGPDGDPVADLEPVTDAVPAPPGDAPEGWVTPWDTPPAPPIPPIPSTPPGAPMSPSAPSSGPAEDPLAEPDTPAVPSSGLPPMGGETEVVPAGWPPPPPAGGALPDAPPLPIGSWEPIGGGAAPAAPDAGEAAPFGADHDGATAAGALSSPAAEPAVGSGQAVAKLLISDGQTVVVESAVLIGRAPEARRFTSTEQPVLIAVPSRLHEISSTHVEVRPGTGADHGSAVVTDMGSTNGTVLVQPGLGPEDLKPGIAVPLIPGAIINLGDGITIQVTRP